MNTTARKALADERREKIANDPAGAIAVALATIDEARVVIAVAAAMLDEDRRKLAQLRELAAQA